MSRFDIIPFEIAEHIMSFMGLTQKEQFTKAYMKYYDIFKEEKRKFLIENYHLGYEPLCKVGIESCIERNILCINSMLREKGYIIESFPDIFRDIFVDINTPIIEYTPSYERPLESHCMARKIEYHKCFGRNNKEDNSRKYIFLKIKNKDEFISLRESAISKEWFCVIGGSVTLIISNKYIDFSLVEKITNMI